ncbi:MAG: hypothetical protein M3295_02425 [Chloroflexota bacterium]|nr:hypothetical protein [Chloroflexota bacterium]
MTHVNRSQALVLSFLVAVFVALVVILVTAPSIYETQLAALGLRAAPLAIPGFVGLITVLLAVLAMGTVRRWRWTFWLMLAALASGAIRVPVSVLQVMEVLPLDVPKWYAALQAVIGVAQLAIVFALWRGYRRDGVWGAF